MFVRSVIGISMLVLLTGCATTRQPTTAGQLQIRIAQLEGQLDDQNAMITHLQAKVEELASRPQVSDASYRAPAPTKTVTRVSRPASTVTAVSSDSTEIIRVPATSREVQTALKNAGYYTGTIDGNIGSGSKRAIREFQTEHDLVSDGIIGKKTWAELKNYLK